MRARFLTSSVDVAPTLATLLLGDGALAELCGAAGAAAPGGGGGGGARARELAQFVLGAASERSLAESLHRAVFWSCDNPTLGDTPVAALAAAGPLATLVRARVIAAEYDGVVDPPTVVACALGRIASVRAVAVADYPDAAAGAAAEVATRRGPSGEAGGGAADEEGAVPAATDAAGSDPVSGGGAPGGDEPRAAPLAELGVGALRPLYKLVVHVRSGADAAGVVWRAGDRRGERRARVTTRGAVGAPVAALLDGLSGVDADVELYNLDADPRGTENLAQAPSDVAVAAARELWSSVQQLQGPLPLQRRAPPRPPAPVLVTGPASAGLVAAACCLAILLLARILLLAVLWIV
jgi:hypothetical protein